MQLHVKKTASEHHVAKTYEHRSRWAYISQFMDSCVCRKNWSVAGPHYLMLVAEPNSSLFLLVELGCDIAKLTLVFI